MLIRKFWKLNDMHDRMNAKKQLKKYKNKRKKRKYKNNIDYFEKEYQNNYKYFINGKLINLSNLTKNVYSITCPEIFSLKHNYDNSVEFICHVSSLACKIIYKNANYIYINLKKCKVYDLDASCVLDSVMSKLVPLLRKHNINFQVDFPEDKKSLAFKNIITTGFVNDNGWHTKKNLSIKKIREKLKETLGIKFVDFNKNNIENYDIITTEIVEMIFSNFINKNKYISSMGKIISEIVDNVREHSENKSWYIVGNFLPNDEYNKSSIRLAIFNYGVTISENLKNFMNSETAYLPSKQEKIVQISKEIIKKHIPFFSDDYYEEEQAYTFLAMQQGISSKIIDDNNINKRGSGIYKLNSEIYKISDLSDGECVNLSIISGTTMINFKNKYRYQMGNEIDEKLYQINFNSKNSIYFPQDHDCIKKLKYAIPGTIIYIDFKFKEGLVNE